MDRRDFLKRSGVFLVGAPCAYVLHVLPVSGARASSGHATATRRWGMVIDLHKCLEDCTACVESCRHENNVALHGDERWDVYWIRKVDIESKEPAVGTEESVPLLCNHCDDPPCALVCPVQATYRRDDGIVIVDHHRCIGCRYCMIACPYNARFFNYKENHDWHNKNYPKRSHGVAEACNFCAHRLDDGRLPACVETCQGIAGALTIGDLNDPHSEVSRLIADNPVKRLREDFGTEPKVYYIGLPGR
ncbi:MAG: 4Fe-4S dicluster domain-containing protein [Candidatus Latescibacterota bacterium]|nr:MAG: 4Fe-4S dicluster domain-containing protein [Candidatus Latescibacterota bacterium]